MKSESAFVISPFTNPSGEIVFRLSGWLDGQRIRKNFSTRAEAEVERQVLEIQSFQNETGVRKAITRLTLASPLHPRDLTCRRYRVPSGAMCAIR